MAQFNYQAIMQSGAFAPFHLIPPNDEARQLVIPDIHGCAKTFRALVAKVDLKKEDQLFLLGDYIDKGPDNAGVIDFILELLAAGYQVLPLRGNHEEMLIASHQAAEIVEDNYARIPRLNKRKGIVDRTSRILPKYEAFFLNLPYFYELEQHLLVHAGFNLGRSNPKKDYEAMLWTADFEHDGTVLDGKTVIIGHVSTMLQFIEDDVEQRNALITLDNGCVYPNKWFRGNLLCLDIHAWHLTIQPNIESN